MEKQTYISDVIDVIDKKRACDETCKKVLASKEIASRILKAVVAEYKNCSVEDIITYISDVSISPEPVDPDTVAPAIALNNSEDSTVLEGRRLYDIKFTAKAPDENHDITLIINIEAQKNYDPGYSLIKRGIYYCCRLISSQYGTVFTESDYDKLQKVYSIWICTDPDRAHRNTITQYSLSPALLFGEMSGETDRSYDMLSLIMVCLDNNTDSENDIISLLTTLFSREISANEKKSLLQSKYGIKMTKPFDTEVEKMCNISEMYFEDGMKRGMKQGKNEEKIKIAKNLLALGTVSKGEIAKATGLDAAYINELAKQTVPDLS